MDEDSRAVIWGQIHQAFGQGAATLHATPAAVRALDERYAIMMSDDLCARWREIAPQLLERIRAVGRLAAQRAAARGAEAIDRDEFLSATLTVEQVSDCPHCPWWLVIRRAAESSAAPSPHAPL